MNRRSVLSFLAAAPLVPAALQVAPQALADIEPEYYVVNPVWRDGMIVRTDTYQLYEMDDGTFWRLVALPSSPA